MRLFLAIDIPKKNKQEIFLQTDKLRKDYRNYNWVDSQNYHITVVFLGDINNHQKVIKKINQELYDQEPFYLYSNRADLFINKKIVGYLDFKREKRLEKRAEKIRKSLGINDGKKFAPHLTLFRGKVPSKQQYFVLKKRLLNLDISVELSVKKLILFASILRKGKPQYKKIALFKLPSN